MGILQLPTPLPAQVGINPATKKMVTTDNISTITAAGYLNAVNLESYPITQNDVLEVLYSYSTVTNSGTYGIFTVSISNGVITLASWANPGDVLLPVVSGDFANFNGTSGQIFDAGYSPSNAAKTKVVMANGASIVSHIATYTDTAGTIGEDATTAINGGNIQAGLSGTAGTLASFPATAANGSLIIAGVAAGGAFTTTVSNGTMGQSTVYTIPDIGASTGDIVVSTTALRMKSVAQAAVAGGAAAQTVTDTFCTSGSMVTASWNDTTNAVSIQKVAAGNGSFIVTSSGDPGSSHLNYIITK